MKSLKHKFLLLLLFSTTNLLSQDPSSPILFIYDASGSMWAKIQDKTKKEIAADVLSTAIAKLPEHQHVGLIAYGHRQKEDCLDVEWLAGMDNTSKEKVIEGIKGITPTGRTPLAHSATLAINALRQSGTKATIILITDGIESCDGQICEVIAAAKTEGIEFKLHIVGFGLAGVETEQLKCAAASGGGQYFDAADAEGLSEMLTTATSQTIDDPPGNLSVYVVKNGKPVDAWVQAVPSDSKKISAERRTYRDTAFLYLTPGDYNIIIRPLENTDIPAQTLAIHMTKGESTHQTVSFDAAILEVHISNNLEGWDGIVKLMNKSNGTVEASKRTYGRPSIMEVNPGNYDVEFKALVIEGLHTIHTIESIELKGGETRSLTHDFQTGIAMVGVRTSAGELIDATVNFFEKTSGKNIAGAKTYTSDSSNPKKFILSPGTYQVNITTLGKHKGTTDSFEMNVAPGKTIEKILTY